MEAHRLFSRAYRAQAELGLATVAGTEEDYPAAARHSRQAVRFARQITPNRANRLSLEGQGLLSLIQSYTQRLESEGPADSLQARIRQYGQALTQVAGQMRAAAMPAAALGILAGWWRASSDRYGTLGRLDSARAAGQRAAAAFQELGALKPYLTTEQHLINVEARAGKHARAVALARATSALAHQMRLPLLEADCLEPMALSLDALGDGHGAYQASARALNLRDSLFSSEKRAAVSELQVRFDTERQRARVRELTHQQQLTQARTAQERQRLWTWLVAAAAGLLLLGAYVWQRVAAARRAADRGLRTRLAADLHDEVGALLTRVTMRTELLQADHDLPQLDVLLTESRSAASTVRDIIWSVNTATDTVGALVDRLRDLRDQTSSATPSPVHLALTPDRLDPAARLRPDVRQHTYLICKEAVTNALKHGRPGQPVRLALHLAPDALTLTVANAAPAAPAAERPRSGQGQRSMAYRAQLLGGTLASGPDGSGWQVALRVPRPLA